MAMTLRVEGPDDEALNGLATRFGVSKHQAALLAIRATHARVSKQDVVEEAAGRMTSEWQPVLDRLSST